MLVLISCVMLYLLLNTLLITLDVNHVIMTIPVNKHFYSDKITSMETRLWCVVCLLLTVCIVNYICLLFVDLTVTQLLHFYVYILVIMLLWLCLHSVFCVFLYFTSCSIDNINRVAKFSIFIHLILSKKNKIKLYPRTQYNSASIIWFLYNSSITFIIIVMIAIRLSNRNTFINVNTVIVELYTILIYIYFFDRYAQYNILWNTIPAVYNKYKHST